MHEICGIDLRIHRIDPFERKEAHVGRIAACKPQILDRYIEGKNTNETENIRGILKENCHEKAKAVKWNDGDILVLKNKIIMHGRTYCENQSGRVISVIQRKGLRG